ncbi:MAG: 3-methylornithine--L-lysine ligase PylC [Candidatus Aminicenantes bacterium]|nr:3-methylornithine--L-lysine ligase PylC [Candidatus Aminicenantes bacterium]NIM83737.1 3-methylornithine--L-lysine ligase PylC [Candidatus Aminicenantes bacterium]NIN23197.1 3-methylornithine--L-lysine ligase PylC [Candidatus Aminicenantes bacterium]NIN46891.1 3-methylornithine--L-lysine ligase PylC [Candidatus Aminicenantes bacterium]NIN89813.1 3-methylornithine--L-lysine ligase PylC [Candidatus Aminicenantes bacterium]
MLIAVVGGGLQGVEAAYLAYKAGWEVLLLDKKPDPPASGLCDHFEQMDVTAMHGLESILNLVDLVIPAVENRAALESLVEWSCSAAVPLAFDMDAYGISSSKLESDRLFARIGVPAPLYWPECGFPVFAKPSRGSGSEKVQLFHNPQQLENRFSHVSSLDDWVLQEYVDGPCFSLEVVGYPGHYTAVQVTDLEMDAGYDCKRVLAPTRLPSDQVNQFEKISLDIAEVIQLKGLMDVEVILHNGQLKVLEIDARLPSQTPTAVYWSTGINLLELLASVFSVPSVSPVAKQEKRWENEVPGKGVVYEHIRVSNETIEVCGEHIMKEAGPLHLQADFFGADEALTNYAPGRNCWAATLIVAAADRSEAIEKRNRVIEKIQRNVDIREELPS